MWPTLILVALFVAAMAALPWLVRRMQQKNWLPRGVGMARGTVPVPAQVLGSLTIGPQQRVVTVQVGEGDAAVRLVLGVTAQQIQCLHRLDVKDSQGHAATHSVANPAADSAADSAANQPLSGQPSFSDSLAQATTSHASAAASSVPPGGAGRNADHV